MVFLVGQYSTGKTSFIQSILGKEYPGSRIGPEPTTDRFVAVMGGEEDRVVPGNAAAIQGDRPFAGLSRFGSNFLGKFEISETCSPVLDSVTLIDSPGVLSGDKQRLGRSYEFAQVCQWFAERASLILLFFDAHKLDISDELKQVISLLRPFDDKIRIILNKADQVNQRELMRVYGALMWSLGKVIETPEVVRVYTGSFRPLANLEGYLAEERAELLTELNNLPVNAVTRKINDLVKRARSVRVHALLLNHLRSRLPTMFGRSAKKEKLLSNLAPEFTAVQQTFNLSPGDFPDLEQFQAELAKHDIGEYPKLSTRMVNSLEDALQFDIPNLMTRFNQSCPSVFAPTLQNPFKRDDLHHFADSPQLWSYSSIDMEATHALFNCLNPDNKTLNGSKCREFFMQSKLSEEEMAALWELADIDFDGALTLPEFAIMLQLVKIRLAGGPIPTTLPDTLRPPPGGMAI